MRLTYVGGLRMQHVDQRSAPVERHRQSLGEPGDDGYATSRGESIHRESDRRAGTYVAKHPAQLGRQLAPARCHHPFQRRDRALPGGDRQRHQVGDRGELGQHPLLTLAERAAQLPVAPEHAEQEGDAAQEQQRNRRHRRSQGPQQPHTGDAGEPDQAPLHLLDPELLGGQRRPQSIQSAANARRAAERLLDALGQPA